MATSQELLSKFRANNYQSSVDLESQISAVPSTVPNAVAQPNTISEEGGVLRGFSKGFGKGIIESVQTLGQLGLR